MTKEERYQSIEQAIFDAVLLYETVEVAGFSPNVQEIRSLVVKVIPDLKEREFKISMIVMQEDGVLSINEFGDRLTYRTRLREL